MACVDVIAAPSDSSIVQFQDLYLGRTRQEVVCRLLRFWDSRNIKRDNEFMGITMLLLDEKNCLHLRCNKCVSSRITGIVRYRVELSVQDDTGKASFVVFDTVMTKLISKAAATLTVEKNTARDEEDADLPQCLKAFVGKTYLFTIRVTPFNFTANHSTFTVTTMTEEDPNEVEIAPAEPAIEAAPALLAIQPNEVEIAPDVPAIEAAPSLLAIEAHQPLPVIMAGDNLEDASVTMVTATQESGQGSGGSEEKRKHQ